MAAKLILRDKEYEVPEAVIATRDGEMITDDEILRDGDVVKLIAVISGG